MGWSTEPLSEGNLAETVAFVRRSNPFAQLTWGWDAGRFVDWRWGTNTVFEAASPGWFSEQCRLHRNRGEIRAVSLSEYGGEEQCVLTSADDGSAMEEALAWLLEHRPEVRLDCATTAGWLRSILTEHGFREGPPVGCEWEFDLQAARDDAPLPDGFVLRTLDGESVPDYRGIADCIQSAFGSEFDFEPGLRSLEANPLHHPDLSVFVRSPDGRIAAYCRGTVDPDTGVAGIDPVCCHPEFQRLGLSTAVVHACFQAQRRLGGRYAYIGSAPEPAPGTFLYQSLGPTRTITLTSWSR